MSGSIPSFSALKFRLTSLASHLSPVKYRVVVCRDFGDKVMPLLYSRKDLEIILWPEDRICERAWLLEKIPGAAAVILTLTEKVSAELLDLAGPNLRVVSTMSVGYEHVDTAELVKRNIRLGYTPDVLTDAVADITVMLALMAGRNAGETLTLVKTGHWPQFTWAPFGFCGPQLSTYGSGKRTVGFIGFGRIAHATLARLVPFGITDCIYYSTAPYPERDETLRVKYNLHSIQGVTLDELAAKSDVLFVLAPGGPETKHMVNEGFLRKMQAHSVLVNTARGTIVDSDALVKALKEKWIWAAGLDVVEGEPNIGADHPLVKEPRCVILPHIGSATTETRLSMCTLAVNNALAVLDGTEMPAECKI